MLGSGLVVDTYGEEEEKSLAHAGTGREENRVEGVRGSCPLREAWGDGELSMPQLWVGFTDLTK